MSTSKVSLVIPVYNEEESLPVLAEQLRELIKSELYDFELIFVNDGSVDNSLSILLDFQEKDARFRVVDLGRNFGSAAAFSAGIDYADGDAVVLLNADLQDPPELVSEFLRRWEEGYDVVYAIRENRKEIFIKRLAYSLFYRILKRIAATPMPLDAGCFGLMAREVVDIIRSVREHNQYLPGMRSWVGFRQVGVPYDRPPRFAGRASGFGSLVRFGLDGIFSLSTLPLTLISYSGLLLSVFGFISVLIYFYRFVVLQAAVPGFASLISALMFFAGIILVSLGIIGQYIARIYDEVRARPLYTVKQTYGWAHKPTQRTSQRVNPW